MGKSGTILGLTHFSPLTMVLSDAKRPYGDALTLKFELDNVLNEFDGRRPKTILVKIVTIFGEQ